MKVFRTTDRIPLKIDTLTFWISPLSYHQKAEILSQVVSISGEEKQNYGKMVFLSVKFAVKKVEGLEDSDGKPYRLEFDGEVLSDDSVNDLLQLDCQAKLTQTCANLMNGIRDSKIEGVEFDLKNVMSGTAKGESKKKSVTEIKASA